MKKQILFILLLLSIKVNAQVKETKISIDFKNLNKKEALEHIQNNTNYTFFYLDNWLDNSRKSKKFNNVTINEILDFIFTDSTLNYYIHDNNKIILTQGNLIRKSIYEVEQIAQNSNITTENVVEPVIINSNTYKNTKPIKIGKEQRKNPQSTYNLTGIIVDQKSKKPIEGVILIERAKNISTTTNKNGVYNLKLPYGENKIEALLIGYNNIKKKLIIYNNGNLNFKLSENSEQLDEVTINTNKNKNTKQVISGITELKSEEIKTIPLVLGERDILKVATTMPGIKSLGEGAEGINVRGGKIDQNLFLLDNGVIYNPTHFLGLFSAINPFTTNNIKIYKGNIPSEFGGRISSVFDIQTKVVDKQKLKGEVSIGPVTGNVSIQTPIIKDKSGVLVGIRSTYSDWVLKSLKEEKLAKSSASFFDFITKYDHLFNKKNSLFITGYHSKDKYQIASDTINSYQNTIVSLNWKHSFNDKNTGNLILSNSTYSFNSDYESNGNNNFNLDYKLNETNLKLKFKYVHSKKHSFNYGLSSKLYNISPGNLTPKGNSSSVIPVLIPKEKAMENSVFLSDKYNISKKLSLNLGLRYTLYSALGASTQNIYKENSPKNGATLESVKNYENNEIYKNYQGLSYRLSGRYLLNKNLALKGSFSKLFQFIHRLSNNTSASPIDTWRLSNLNIKPQDGTQVSLGLFQDLKNNYEISLDGYYKKYNNIVDYKVGASLLLNKNIETEILQGEGKSYGIEFLLRKNAGKLNGWLSYSYSRSLIKLDSKHPEERVNNGLFFPTNFDKPHDLNIILNYKLTKRFSLSSNFSYQSGRPVTYPSGKYILNGTEYLLYSDRNTFRIPDYYRLDIGFNVEGNHKIKKFAHSFWNISIYNVLGRNNPYSVFFETRNGRVSAYKSSVFSVPVPTITYNFKF
ncbi:TonB-dependent receptor [Tenacibaculum aiptasiae]|uniref:TonB-dependent receptor n=1 Tax=Tenacibaculum aiptasiae TaxID=426481 RepID=A0A7J5AL52_9FLAO|nr:TonB-dependent receptor [Tenacibaculum aiptasiae]KAB1158304.1 TonB-dependent receptor [Tenacibaculum aiptasiae]